MKKIFTLACLAVLAATANAERVSVDHEGDGMTGDGAYITCTFNDATGTYADAQARVEYTMANTEGKLSVSATFSGMQDFVGLVPAAYMFIDGVGETPLNEENGAYTATTAAVLTEGQEYTGYFKRLSSGAYFGGDLLFPFKFQFGEGGTITPPEPVEPGVLSYYVLPAWEGMEKVLPTTWYNWWNGGTLADGTETIDGIACKTWTMTLAGANGCGGWLTTGYDVSPILTHGYNLKFWVKSTATCVAKVKLSRPGDPEIANEVPFEFERDGQWHEVVMNLHETFPQFAASGATDGDVYMFSFVAGDAAVEGDAFSFSNVRYIPVDGDDYKPALAPEHLYLLGAVEGHEWSTNESPEMTKEGSVFTITATLTSGANFKFTTTHTADAGNWDGEGGINTVMNYGQANDNAVVTLDTPFALVGQIGQIGAINVGGAGKYTITADFIDAAAPMCTVAKAGGETAVVPEHLYLMGAVKDHSWSTNDSPEMTKDSNVFSITVDIENDANFKFTTVSTAEPADWTTINSSLNYGQAVDNEIIATDTEVPMVAVVGEAGAFRLAEPGLYTITADFTNAGVPMCKAVKKSDAIETVESASTAAAEYYTLQGVRIAEPAAGMIVIRRLGTTVEKIVVR